jgi:hypothetical protein
MRTTPLTSFEAHEFVRSKSSTACPNRGFMKQLITHGRASMDMMVQCRKCHNEVCPFILNSMTHQWTYICTSYFMDRGLAVRLLGSEVGRLNCDSDQSGSILCASCGDHLGKWSSRHEVRCLCKSLVDMPLGLSARKIDLILTSSCS